MRVHVENLLCFAATERDEQMLENDSLEAKLAKLKNANVQLRMHGDKGRVAHGRTLQALSDQLEAQGLELSSREYKMVALEGQVAAVNAEGLAENAQGLAERVRVLERELGQALSQSSESLLRERQANKGLRGEVRALHAEVGELETALAEKEGVLGVLERNLQGIIRARDLLKSEAEGTQAGLRESLEKVEGTLARERAALRARVWAPQAETNRLGAERDEAVGALQREVASAAEVQADLEVELMEVQGEKAELLARIEQLEKQVGTY